MTKSKSLALLLALAMLVSLLAACGSSPATSEAETAASGVAAEEIAEASAAEASAAAEPESGTAAASAEEATEAEPEPEAEDPSADIAALKQLTAEDFRSEEPKEYTMWMVLSRFVTQYVEDPQEELVLLQEMRDRLNVSFDFTLSNPDAVDTEFSLMIASGDYCDVISEMNYYTLGIDDAIDQEIIRDVYDLVQEHAPLYWDELTKHVPSYMTMVTDSGKMGSLCVFISEDDAKTEQRGYITNGAWYDEFNLDIAQTLDQFHEYLTLAHDNYGAQFSIAQYGMEQGVLSAYNIEPGMYVVDGEVRYGYVEPEMKDYLQLMNQWYSEGLLETEFYNGTTDTGAQLAGTANGRFSAWAGTAQVSQNVYKFDEEGHTSKVAGTPYLKMNESDEMHVMTNISYQLQNGSSAWSFRYDLPDEDVITLLKVADYMFTDEGYLLYNYGVEGQAFEYDANGEPQWTDLIINDPDLQYNQTSYIYATHNGTTYMPGLQKLSKGFYGFTDDQRQAMEAFSGVGDDAYSIPRSVVLNTEEMATYQQYATDVETYINQIIVDWIIAEPVTDASWEEFVNTLHSMGVDDMIRVYQSAYDRYSDRYGEAEAVIAA